MKVSPVRLRLIVILLVYSYSASAQKNFWSDAPRSAIAIKPNPAITLPKQYRPLRLDTANLGAALRIAPKEFTQAAKTNPLIIMLPFPGGGFKRFKIVQTVMMEPGLAAKFSNIRTYGGQGIDDPYSTIKIDWTDFGFHAMILSQTDGSVIIDPYVKGSLVDYISYNKSDAEARTAVFDDGVLLNKPYLKNSSNSQRTSATTCIGTALKEFRLAVACTWEYAVAVGGRQVTPAQALSAIVTTVNRVNGVYETEVDVRLTLVGNNDKIIFTDSATQPFRGNKNAIILINESQDVIDSRIGSGNYDIGHTFSTGAGGYASVGVVGQDGSKARGVTGSPQPVGDAYNIDYVAHEIGHQFGANHTFNASTGSCGGGNGSSTTNAEPGSGSTIMAYAGICQASNNLQPHSIPYFHAVSFDEITSFVNGLIDRSTGTFSVVDNPPPVVNAGNGYVIPKSTPFVLTGLASDPDGDPLTYSWEQINVGGPFTDWNKPSGDAPIFRSFSPVTSPVRYFPQLSDIRNNTTTMGELLPSYARTLKFRLTARDNRLGCGGVCSAETNVTVDGNAGPFIVTAPNTATSWDVGSFNTVTWDVAKTNLAPVNCTNVNIELSVDGGLTYPITLASNTPNDGIEEILVPNNITTKARIRVTSVGNVFFDISNVDFAIRATPAPGFTLNNPLPVAACNNNPGTVIKTSSLNNFSAPITFSASGNPAGSTVAFVANSINPGSNDSITLKGNIPSGIYNITVSGTAGAIVVSRVIQFVIGAPVNAPIIASPADASIGTPLLAAFNWKPTVDALYYSLQISTSSTFASTVSSVDSIAGLSYTLTTPLATNTEYYWRVIPRNTCGVGPASAGSLFKTVAVACGDIVYSQDVPKTIDTLASTTTSTLVMPEGGLIQHVKVVGLKGTHSYVGDLTINLISPSKTKVELFRQACANATNFDLNLDDQATGALVCPVNNGQTSKPGKPLSAFNNESSTGTWQLEVIDSYDGDGGSLTGWGLQICTYQSTALPVNWLNFTANKNTDKTVQLQWSVANEVNNIYYEIEKGVDGITFQYVGIVNAGNSTGAQQYLFKDLTPYSGENFYRLKQVDKDGHYNYSKIAKVYIKETDEQYVVYPNPAVDKATLRVLNETKQLTIQLRDASGKIFYKKSVGSVKAGQEFEIPVKGFSKGLYILSLSTEKETTNEKVMVQ